MQVKPEILEEFHRELLENNIIKELAEMKSVSLRVALDIYYRSELATQINQGAYGIQYLSPKYLANDLIENEKECFMPYTEEL